MVVQLVLIRKNLFNKLFSIRFAKQGGIFIDNDYSSCSLGVFLRNRVKAFL